MSHAGFASSPDPRPLTQPRKVPTVPEPRDTPDPLKRAQRRRVVAAAAARDVLATRSVTAGDPVTTSVKAPEVTDLVALASWIMTGEDPWPTPPRVVEDPTETPDLDDEGPF